MTEPRTFDLAYWITERYAMKLRKDAGPPRLQFGYSADPHMGTVRYCNVHREDDKVTKWLAKNWRPHHHAVWEIVLARMINYIPSLEELSTRDSYNGFCRAGMILKERRARGDKVFTSAYTISTCGQAMDKIDYVMGVVELCKDGNWSPFSTLEAAHKDIMYTEGLGSFLAAQVVADLKNTAGHPLQAAPDWWAWAAPGPGSLRGLEAFWTRKITPGQFNQAINDCWKEVKPLIPDYIPPIHMQDFQNCLCEFSKFMRVKEGGHARNRYTASAG